MQEMLDVRAETISLQRFRHFRMTEFFCHDALKDTLLCFVRHTL